MKRISCPRVVVCAACAGLLLGHSPAFGQTQSIPPAELIPPANQSDQASASTPAITPAPSTPTTTSPAAFPNLFEGLVGDFRRLPSTDTAKWLGIGASMALVGRAGDSQLSRVMSGSNDLREALGGGQTLGGTPLQFGGAMATYAIGRMAGSSRTAQVGAELFRAQVVAQAMTSIMKVSVGRSRPDGDSYSFPSGHTASTFASATVLQRNFGWKVGIPAYAVAYYVAASRIQTQRHYLSDVAFGAALGILAGRTVTVGHSKARFAVAPFAVEGGAGINFNWAGSN